MKRKQVLMTNAERIIENVNAIMSMEEMPLMESDKIHIRKCIDEKINFDDIINELIQNYM